MCGDCNIFQGFGVGGGRAVGDGHGMPCPYEHRSPHLTESQGAADLINPGPVIPAKSLSSNVLIGEVTNAQCEQKPMVNNGPDSRLRGNDGSFATALHNENLPNDSISASLRNR